MKNQIQNFLFIAALAISFGFGACNNASEEPEEAAEEVNEEKLDNPQEKDAEFMVHAATLNLKEVELSKMALPHLTMNETKQMAQMMVDDHSKAYTELSTLATAKNITIPAAVSDEDRKEAENLAADKPENIDKNYCDKLVAGHKDAIDKFEHAANNANDAEIRSWANSMLPSLRSHLAEAEKCQEMAKTAHK